MMFATPGLKIGGFSASKGKRVFDTPGTVVAGVIIAPLGAEPELDHVADANARLSIDPTGKVAGYRVIQDDGPTTYEFQGTGADADAGLWVTGAGDVDHNGSFYWSAGDSKYIQIGGAGEIELNPGVDWHFRDNSYATDDIVISWPWSDPSWVSAAGTPPAPTVTRNPIASEANWSVIP